VIYQNPVILFHLETAPLEVPSLTTPPAECQVTRSEVHVMADRVTVRVWCAPAPARPGPAPHPLPHDHLRPPARPPG
jgi:hypothetical protein